MISLKQLQWSYSSFCAITQTWKPYCRGRWHWVLQWHCSIPLCAVLLYLDEWILKTTISRNYGEFHNLSHAFSPSKVIIHQFTIFVFRWLKCGILRPHQLLNRLFVSTYIVLITGKVIYEDVGNSWLEINLCKVIIFKIWANHNQCSLL